jgi:hypothetical protein
VCVRNHCSHAPSNPKMIVSAFTTLEMSSSLLDCRSSQGGPDGQADVLQLNLAVERIFDEGLVLVLIPVEINEKRKCQDASNHEAHDDQ